VNLQRTPVGGRNFECASEEPFRAARMAAAFVRGVQGGGVGACVKHFAGNDVEWERHRASVEADERTLREGILPPFEAAVREAGVWSVTAAYNRLGGVHCTEHARLLTGILRDEWGFDGAVISDWFATQSTAPSLATGLDLEMPGPPRHYGARLAAAVRAGEVSEATLDAAVRRVLGLLARTGALDAPEGPPPERADDRPEHRALAREAAAAGTVLLRNERGALPLAGVRRLAVIGPTCFRTLPALAAADVEGAIELALFAGEAPDDTPLRRETVPGGELPWLQPPAPIAEGARFAARLRVDGREAIDLWRTRERGSAFFGLGSREIGIAVPLAAGASAELEVDFAHDQPGLPAGLRLGFAPPEPADALERAVAAARGADAAVVVVGLDEDWETEGRDRDSLALPGRQDELVAAIAAANPCTIVVVNAGSPVAMPWVDDTAALLQLWYPGQEGGRALATCCSATSIPAAGSRSRSPCAWRTPPPS
jgi:beta-glucosidase